MEQLTPQLRLLIRRIWWPLARWLLRWFRTWERQPLIQRRLALVLSGIVLLGLLAGSIRFARLHRYTFNATNTKSIDYGNPHPKSAQAQRP